MFLDPFWTVVLPFMWVILASLTSSLETSWVIHTVLQEPQVLKASLLLRRSQVFLHWSLTIDENFEPPSYQRLA